MNSINNQNAFELEDIDGKVLAFLVCTVTQKSVIEVIGERSERGDGATVYILDDFLILKNEKIPFDTTNSVDITVDYIYDFFKNFIEEVQQDKKIVFSVKIGKVPVQVLLRSFEKLQKNNYIDDIKMNSKGGTILLICG